MINVNDVYEQVATLSRKAENGYHSGEDFNAQARLVQAYLFDWYFARSEKNQRIVDSLRPFIKEPVLPINSGEVALPSDYRHRIEVAVGYVQNNTDTEFYPAPYIDGKEEVRSSRSYVRRPSITRKRFYHTIKASTIKILPTDFNGVVRLKYLAYPADVNWASQIDTDNDVENYTSTGSIHFEWEPMDEQNIVSLFLFLKGIQTRQSELIQWVAEQRQIVKSD